MKKAIKQFETNKSKLLDKLQHDAEKESLLADDVISQLFDKAIFIETRDDILEYAVTRFNMGNPPGKDKSYGDAINWESLLYKVPENEDLHFISDDKDYYSKLNSSNFNNYLLKEWKDEKEADIIYYKRLTELFKDQFPDIEITSETEKDIVIKNLIEAFSFDTSKRAIRKLREYDNFSVKQINDIANAFASNNQIYWIPTDYTVRTARNEIIECNFDKLEPDILSHYKRSFELY